MDNKLRYQGHPNRQGEGDDDDPNEPDDSLTPIAPFGITPFRKVAAVGPATKSCSFVLWTKDDQDSPLLVEFSAARKFRSRSYAPVVVILGNVSSAGSSW